MTIKVGDKLPEGTLSEFIEVEGNGCSVGPNQFKVEDLTKGKKVVIFGLPGAFTPTCSAKHVPSYLANYDKLKAKGVDEIYCMSVNDPFVMGAWGRDQHASGKVHMMARRQRRLHEEARARARPHRPRHGRALPALLDAGRQRRGQGAQHRGARASTKCPDGDTMLNSSASEFAAWFSTAGPVAGPAVVISRSRCRHMPASKCPGTRHAKSNVPARLNCHTISPLAPGLT